MVPIRKKGVATLHPEGESVPPERGVAPTRVHARKRAIELDDSSHKRNDRIARDKFLNEAMEEANVPLLRFQARSSYTTDQIAQKIAPLKQKDAA